MKKGPQSSESINATNEPPLQVKLDFEWKDDPEKAVELLHLIRRLGKRKDKANEKRSDAA